MGNYFSRCRDAKHDASVLLVVFISCFSFFFVYTLKQDHWAGKKE